MDITDKPHLNELLKGAGLIYNKLDANGNMPLPLIAVYFEALKQYSIDQVSGAMSKHMMDVDHGQFFPKPADIVRHIEGGSISADEIISAARLAQTPMGIMARIQIGTHDLNNQTDMFYLKQRAQECIDLMPQWKEKHQSGNYTDHEISVMLKHKVRPSNPFISGLEKPVTAAITDGRAKEIFNSEKHKQLIAPVYEEVEGDKCLEAADSVKEFLKEFI
tara:strand:+ start:585 stop:1241 length:657 start_codon:yes stop_codon:yes gene_type:complete